MILGKLTIFDCVGVKEIPHIIEVRKIMKAFCKRVDLLIINEYEKEWEEPYGYTINLTLSESHLACHTFLEHESVCFDLFSCKEIPIADLRWLKDELEKSLECKCKWTQFIRDNESQINDIACLKAEVDLNAPNDLPVT